MIEDNIRWDDEDKLKDECGVIGLYDTADYLANVIAYGLISLQHRGQESAGIATLQNGQVNYYKDMGLVKEVFDAKTLSRLSEDTKVGIGHVRYSTTGESYVSNAQPLVVRYRGGSIALAHNGNLVNAAKIRQGLEEDGSIFQTSIDSEVIANLIAKHYKKGMKEALLSTLKVLKGSFALTIIMNEKLIGVRDPLGIRPLCLGKTEKGYILASETCAIDVCGGTFVRDIQPGEMVIIDEDGVESIQYSQSEKQSICAFEYVYFARPDSVMDGQSIYMTRKNAGKILAKEHPVDADMVIAVPDSGIAAAIGYAEASKIPYDTGLIKNKYMGRTFIQPDQKSRELAVRLKLNPLRANLQGKKIVMVDDSIVRGTTSKRIIKLLKDAGAKEVHVRVSSPPVNNPCYFGIDTPSKKQLIGAVMSVEDICEVIGADSLGYISTEGLVEAIGLKAEALCTACFTGRYPMEVPKEGSKFLFEKI